MKQSHPFRRALALAIVTVLFMVLRGTPDLRTMQLTLPLPREAVCFAGMAAVGSFLAALPGRIRRGRQGRDRSDGRHCLAAFIGGVLGMLGLLTMGSAGLPLLSGVLQGSAGSLGMLVCAWTMAFLAARLTGRWLA